MARFCRTCGASNPATQSRRQGEGQGRRREAGSEGSPIQSCRAMNESRISGVMYSGRAGTWPRSPPSAVGVHFLNPASMQRR